MYSINNVFCAVFAVSELLRVCLNSIIGSDKMCSQQPNKKLPLFTNSKSFHNAKFILTSICKAIAGIEPRPFTETS